MEKIEHPYRLSAIVVLGSLILYMMGSPTYLGGWYGFSLWIILLLTQTTGVFLFLDKRQVGRILLFCLAGFHALNFLVSTIILIARSAGRFGFHYSVVTNIMVLSLVVAVFVFLFLLMIKQKDEPEVSG